MYDMLYDKELSENWALFVVVKGLFHVLKH